MMRVFSGCLGASVGVVVAITVAGFACDLMSGGDTFDGAFYLMFVGPFVLLFGIGIGVFSGLHILRLLQTGEAEGMTRRKKAYLLTGVVFGIVAIVGGVGWANKRLTGPPSDDAMLVQFQRHKITLDHITQMTLTDKRLERVDYNWTQPDDPRKIGVLPARIGEYRRLLNNAGVHRGFEAWAGTPREISFLYWGQGSAIDSDTDKGFAYLPNPPAHTLSALDGLNPHGEKPVKAYRHITGHWYLYYDYLPG